MFSATKGCHLGPSGVGSGEPGRRQERTDSTGAKIKISTNVKSICERLLELGELRTFVGVLNRTSARYTNR